MEPQSERSEEDSATATATATASESPSAPALAKLTPIKSAVRRRQASTGERINDIIETGRQRAQSVASDPLALHTTMDRDTAPDETTRIMSRAQQGYHSLSKTRAGKAPSLGTVGTVGKRHDDGEDDDDDVDATVGGELSWLRRNLALFQSLELDNKGSVARDHLALERTFLAWLRTSLSFASIGVAVTQLFRLDTSTPGHANANANPSANAIPDGDKLREMGRPLGTAFLVISIVTLLLGCRRYYTAQGWILRGKFPASRGTVLIMSVIALALMVGALVVIVAIQPG